jgi:Tfp pilus assembly protein PilW
VPRVRWADDRGESLVELLVAMLVMGTAVVAVVGGLGTAIMMSDIHRKQAAIGAKLNEYAATIQTAVATSPGYADCADASDYPSYDAGPDYTAEPIQVHYWDGATTFVATCGSDTGVQLVTLRIHSDDGRVTRSMDIVIRKPCRPTDSPCT